MKKSTLAAVSAATTLALSACGSLSQSTSSDEQSGSNAPSSDQVAEPEETDDQDVDAEEADTEVEDSDDEAEAAEGGDDTHEFGETATYPNGLSISVSEPTAYTPSEYAFGHEGYSSSVQFTVKIVNKTGSRFDPSMVYMSMQSGNTEGEEIFDDENGFDGAPSTTVLDGRETTFPVAFGVDDRDDLVLEVDSGDWDLETTIFVKESS